MSRERPERRNLINARDAMLYLQKAHRITVLPATIRQWVKRGHINSYGRRRERYDLREIVAYAQARGIIARPSLPTQGQITQGRAVSSPHTEQTQEQRS